MAHTRTVLACTDPVALDYHATKYILYPNSKITIHNPENKNSPLNHYLAKCAEAAGLVFDEEKVEVKSYDFKTGSFQRNDRLVIIGDKRWGTNIKQIMKYLTLRIFNYI